MNNVSFVKKSIISIENEVQYIAKKTESYSNQ